MTIPVLLFLAFTLIAIIRPKIAVGLVVLLLPTYLVRFQLSGIPVTFLEILVLIFVTVRFIGSFRQIKKIKNLGWLNLAATLFVAAGAISAAMSPDKIKALGELKAFIIEPIFFFYALFLTFNSQAEYRTLFKFLFFGTSAVSAYGIFQYFTLAGLPMRFWGSGGLERIVSVFEYPNALALYLAPAITLFIVLSLKNDWLFPKAWVIFGLTLQILALIMTFSRGALAAVAIVVFTALFRFKGKAILASAAVIILAALLIPDVRVRFFTTSSDPSSSAHLDLMRAGTKAVMDNPVFGNGLYGFRTTLTNQGFQGEILNYPHNIFLNFWVETGLLGLASFIWIIISSISGQKGRTYGLAGAAFLAVMIIHGLVDVPYFKNDLSLLFWSVAAMLNTRQ